MLQVAQLVGELEKFLEGPTVSQAVGQKVINVISNLMGADSVALSASANRYNSHNLHPHTYSGTSDVSKMFCFVSFLLTG